MGATLSAATCTIFGPTFPVQSNAALRFAHRRLGPKLIAVAAQLTKIKYSHLHRPVTHSLYPWPFGAAPGPLEMIFLGYAPMLSPRPSGQLPYPGHAPLFWRTCSWPNPPILLSRFRIMPHSSSSVPQAASSLFTAVADGPRAASIGVLESSSLLKKLERDEDIKIALPGGRLVAASLAGRDPALGEVAETRGTL
jgi:hypothetical protein